MENAVASNPGKMTPTSRALVTGVVAGGSIAGFIDIFSAVAINHASPGVILQAIAGGLLGRASFHDGGASMALGFVLQIVMSVIIAAIYGLASTRLPILLRRPTLFGVLYGFGVFIVMNLIVVPLSALHATPKITAAFVLLNLAAMILFGLIVALSQAFAVKRAQGSSAV